MTDLALPTPSFCALAPGSQIPADTQIIGWYRIAGPLEISRAIVDRELFPLAEDLASDSLRVARMANWLPVVAGTGDGGTPNAWAWAGIAPETSCEICGACCDPSTAGVRIVIEDSNYICNDCVTNEVYVYTIDDEWRRRYECWRNVDTNNWASAGYASSYWYLWEADGQYHSNPEHADEEEDDDDDGVLIYGYHAVSPLRYLSYDRDAIEQGRLLYGVELEMEPKEEGPGAQRDIARALNGPMTADYILSHDGSLNYGVELITAPRTLLQHQTSGLWEAVHRAVASIAKSGVGTDRCGMHVHINRAALTPLDIGKLLVFYNDPGLDRIIRKIAQRDPNRFCKRKDKKLNDAAIFEQNDDRYERVNVTGKGTVEIRIFKGNLRPERIKKNIEFVDASVNFCKACSMRDAADWAAFADWLRPQTSLYPHLLAYLHQREILYFKKGGFPRSITELARTGTEG